LRQPDDVQRQIAELIESRLEEQEWDAIVSTPESQAFLARLSGEIDEQEAAGDVEDGGWDL
jgi:hypothetical protein